MPAIPNANSDEYDFQNDNAMNVISYDYTAVTAVSH